MSDIIGRCATRIADVRRVIEAVDKPSRRIHPSHRFSAMNLQRYLALRRSDLRGLQEDLAQLGLSSLGRCEADVLAAVSAIDAVLGSIRNGDRYAAAPAALGRRRLAENADRILGAAPKHRLTRIMATGSPEVTHDPQALRQLMRSGIDLLRINCGHDHLDIWREMITKVRAAATAARRRCRVCIELGGPKVRIASLPSGPAVLKISPQRDEMGRILEPARLWLHERPETPPAGTTAVSVQFAKSWQGRSGQVLEVADAREKRRELRLERGVDGGWIASCKQTVYLLNGRMLRSPDGIAGTVVGIPALPGHVKVEIGDRVLLTGPDGAAAGLARLPRSPDGQAVKAIPCEEPRIFTHLRAGERVIFDDGHVSGVVVRRHPHWALVEVSGAKPGGTKLRAEKGVVFPDSALSLPALDTGDIADLIKLAPLVDVVGLSFVEEPGEIRRVRRILALHGRTDLPIVLKIETMRGFRNLPRLLEELLSAEVGGAVMIARGDLALACGFERLAELQEEILWLCEAAHVPVIWATQVLEGLSKTGMPSRAEITDAAMGVRAECVMLNKGPHLAVTVATLDDILCRMEAHHRKKSSRLRRLTSW